MTTKNFKPTLKTPTKQGKKLNKHFNKELTKQSSMQQVQKPNIKIKEDKDDFAMKQSGYNDLGVGKLKTNRKKDLDPSFKELTFESLNYIDESDNISLGPIKRNINENKKLITKKELIESTLKEEEKKGNPWAICGAKINKKENPEKYEKCVKEVKKQYGLKTEALEVPAPPEGYYERIEKFIKSASKEELIKEYNKLKWTPIRYGTFLAEPPIGQMNRIKQELKDRFNYILGDEKNNKEEIIDETTTSSSSGQYQTPFAWAPNKKGWANAKKRWWGENSPNTGGSVSKGGVVNIKDSCKGYSNSKTQCNSGDIGNITITEEAQNLIAKLSKEYNKPVEYIKNLIKEDYCNKVTSLKHELNNISDKEISQFVTKQLIKEGYLPEKQNNEEDIETKVREIVANEFDYENWSEEQNQAIEVCMRCYEAAKSSNGYSEKDIRKVLFKLVGEYEGIVDFNKWIDTEIQYLNKSTQKEGYLSINELKQTKDNWRGEGCKNYDDSRDICLDKKVNELYLQDRPIYKHKRTGEVWEASEVGYRDITLVNLKNPTMIINVDKEELKNEYIKLGSGIEENSPPNYTGSYGSYKDVEGDMSLMSPDITENKLK